jgi:nitrogen fixation-related uncharacterized protein
MCPNCVLNQAGLQGGIYIAFGVCAIFFVAALFAMHWAFKNGEFDDMESAKFDMLDDEHDSALIQQARDRVERARQARDAEQQT